MGKFIDLTGHRFGDWTVIEFDCKTKHGVYWKCRCVCGVIRSLRANSLCTSKGTKSCGCRVRRQMIADMVGKQFGFLTVLAYSHSNLRGKNYWITQCVCGKKVTLLGEDIKYGNTKSCGCYRINFKANDITGRRFGRLLVQELLNERDQSGVRRWKCLCDCGNTVITRSAALLAGATKSCGCWHKERITKHGLYHTRECKRVYSRNYLERKKQLDNKWTTLMEICIHVYQPVCVVCGSTDRLCVDHVLPLSKGGGLYPGNSVVLCTHHNVVKSNRELDQLPIEMATKIRDAAESFRIAWSGGF